MKKFYEKIRKVLNRLHPWLEKNFDRTIATFSVVLLCIVLVINKINSDKIKKNPDFAVGIITNINYGKHWSDGYKFYVNGKLYFGSDRRPAHSKIQIGDSVIIMYEADNPDNNEIYCYFIYRPDKKDLKDSINHRQFVDHKLIEY